MNYSNKQDGTSFKEIVFTILKKIGEKASIEFKGGGRKTVDHGNWSEVIDVPDSRLEFIQLVEHLSDLLVPEFSKDTKEKYDAINKKVKEQLEKRKEKKISEVEYTLIKLELMRELFRSIMFNLKKGGYMKGTSYSESDLQELIDEEEAENK